MILLMHLISTKRRKI